MPVIAVIDDEILIAMALEQLVNGWGYRTVAACSEDDVVAKLDGSPAPSLLLVDWRLRHGRTGGEAVTRLRERFGWMIPAIVVTGETSPERLREISELGCPVLHKPVAATVLKTLMADALAI